MKTLSIACGAFTVLIAIGISVIYAEAKGIQAKESMVIVVGEKEHNIKKIYEAHIDKQTGRMLFDEFSKAYGELQQLLPDLTEKAEQAYTNFDENGDGHIDPDEFAEGTRRSLAESQAMKTIYTKHINRDTEQMLFDEFQKAYGELQEAFPALTQEPMEAYKNFDENGDGHISPEEFYDGVRKALAESKVIDG